jgi:iron complex outermembrane receptor protein
MAAIMNNFVGDGNGYVGNQNLKPEVAHTVSATLDLHGTDKKAWQFKLTPYYTYVTDFIDAQRCPLSYSSNCTAANLNATTGFVTLQYVNQTAQIYGADISGFAQLGMWNNVGNLKLTGLMNYARGENLSTGDNLYNIMPLNAKFGLVHNAGSWTNTLEWQLVAEKNHVSSVRNENQTAGYGLVTLRSSYQWKQWRVDIGIENLLNRYYEQPLGGAYVGQGATMGINSVPSGVQVPGYARSINTALSVQF